MRNCEEHPIIIILIIKINISKQLKGKRDLLEGKCGTSPCC